MNLVPALSDETRTELHAKYKAIETRLASMKKVQKSPVKTNGQFKYSPYGNQVASRIHDENDVSVLLQIYSFLKHKKETYDEAAEELGLNAVGFPPFTWLGYKVEDWMQDIKIRISLISYREEYTRLSKLKEQLSEFFLPEDKLKQLLETMEGLKDLDI